MSEGAPKIDIESICREIDELNDERLFGGLELKKLGQFSDFDSYSIEGEVKGHYIKVYSEETPGGNVVKGSIDEVPLTEDYTKKIFNKCVKMAKLEGEVPSGTYPAE